MTEILLRYFSSVFESNDGNERICACKGLSVLCEIAFDISGAFALLDKLDNGYTLTADCVLRIISIKFADPSGLPSHILLNL